MAAQFEELMQMTHRFLKNLDEFRYDEMAAAFAQEGVCHRMGKALKGHAQIMSSLNERSRTTWEKTSMSSSVIYSLLLYHL
jgi:hypothetical protein